MDHPLPLIHFDNVTIRFTNGTTIENISFKVSMGEKFLIYGKSGIGKTTFFRLLLGFEKAHCGHIFFNGEPVNEHTVWTVRKNIAYVSQDLDIGSGPVRSMIKSFFSYAHTKVHAYNDATIEELFAFFDLPLKILQEDYAKLSGGEKQRIALIVVLLLKRDIFLLDEATSSLDRELKLRVIEFFTSRPEWTVLTISHDQDWLTARGLTVLKVGA
ncbi:ATP-binding cassette domain-containing protein [candidate division WOR-3 bacterium]|nr:ATP-binding cassette domain-containing protein [candidate division WOR-3 bacterium]